MVYRSKMVIAIAFFLILFFTAPCRVPLAAGPETVKPGDKIGIQFTCRYPNGDIAASTSTAVAADASLRKSPVYLARSKDDPLEVTAGRRVGANTFPFPFLDEIASQIALAAPGMKLGETRTVNIHSERPADMPEKDQFLQLAKVRSKPKEIRMTRDEFRSRTGKDPEAGAEYGIDAEIKGKITSVSENEVVINSDIAPGSVVETPFGKGSVREDGNQFDIVIDVSKGALVRMGPIVGKVSEVQDKTFTIDFGDPLGGEPLACEVKVEKVPEEKPSKEVK